jgi:hypothetical protein
MSTVIQGKLDGRHVRLLVTDGELQVPTADGSSEVAAAMARGWVAGGMPVSIPGVWSGTAAFDDVWSMRAMFLALLDEGTVSFGGDPPPPLHTESDPPDSVY